MQILSHSREVVVKKYDPLPEPYISLHYKMRIQRKFVITDQGLIPNPRMAKEEHVQDDHDKTTYYSTEAENEDTKDEDVMVNVQQL